MAKRRTKSSKRKSPPKRRGRATAARLGHRRRARKAAASAPKRRRARKVASTPKRRRARKAASAPKRRARKAVASAPKRRARKSARKSVRRKRRRGRATAARLGHRRRARKSNSKTIAMPRAGRGTMLMHKVNPSRRRKATRSKRRGRRAASRRYSKRGYRKNPGGFLIDLAKEALPYAVGFFGTRILVKKLGTVIPGITQLGTLAQPALALAAIVGVRYACGKSAKLAKYKTGLTIGAAMAAVESVIATFAPASIKGMLGMGDIYDQAVGDYVATGGMGDYLAIGGTPIDDDGTLSDYIAVGSDGVEEELGLDQELGVDEELGNDLLGGVGSGSMMEQVPSRQYLSPVPTRSFTRQIPAASGGMDSGGLYQGVFARGF